MSLDAPVTDLSGVGEALAGKLARLRIEQVVDLLFHLPLRYQDRTRITPIGTLRAGTEAVVEGEVSAAEVVRGRRRSLLVRLKDGSGILSLRFFHFSPAQQQQFVKGAQVRCFGEARAGSTGLEIYHPEYRLVQSEATPVDEHLTPIYPATEGLAQPRLRALIQQALKRLEQAPESLPEWIPEPLRGRFRLPGLIESVRYLHEPPPDAPQERLADGRHPAQRRLALEELLAHQLSLRQVRLRIQTDGAPRLAASSNLQARFLTQLPFSLTQAQRRVLEEIGRDLEREVPMLRLVQGDVGSGKTVVAAMAVLNAIAGGCQAAVMAPTEILAEQHFRQFRAWLEPLGIEVGWLAGKLKGKALGMHKSSDSGMVRITDPPDDLPLVDFDKSKKQLPKIGQWCIAVGNPGGLDKNRGAVVRVGRVISRTPTTVRSDCMLLGGDSGGPLFDILGQTWKHTGEVGTAKVVKIVNNMMSMGNVLVAAEAFSLGVAAGVEPEKLFDVISVSGGCSHHFTKRFPNALKGDFSPGFKMELGEKDLSLGIKLGRAHNLPTPTASIVREMYALALAEGFRGQDIVALLAMYDKWAGGKDQS